MLQIVWKILGDCWRLSYWQCLTSIPWISMFCQTLKQHKTVLYWVWGQKWHQTSQTEIENRSRQASILCDGLRDLTSFLSSKIHYNTPSDWIYWEVPVQGRLCLINLIVLHLNSSINETIVAVCLQILSLRKVKWSSLHIIYAINSFEFQEINFSFSLKTNLIV